MCFEEKKILDRESHWTCYNPGEALTDWALRKARDDSASSELLAMLADSCHFELRLAVAANRNVSAETIALLLQDENTSVANRAKRCNYF